MPTTNIIAISDLHINSTAAVCPRVVNLDDGGTYHPSRTQRVLGEALADFTKRAAALQGRRILVINGDMGELDTKKRSIQLVTLNKATIQAMVLDVILPLVDLCEAVLIIRGTEAHTGKSAWLEEAIAQDIENSVWFDKKIDDKGKVIGVASWWQWRGTLDGVRFDIAHHATAGGKPWTRPATTLALAAKATWEYMVDMEIAPPHIFLRSHAHTQGDSHDAYPVRAVRLGCWVAKNSHSHRSGYENKLDDFGGAFITCDQGRVNVEHVYYRPKPAELRRVWANTI